MNLKDITPYEYEKITENVFRINSTFGVTLTIDRTNEDNVIKITNSLNGSFREGVIFGNLNKIE